MSKRILIVEDEESIADLEKDYLELSGFEVEVANDGEIGLKKGLEGEFDLIILDLMLPGVDGFEICRQIRSQKNTPIIMVSAKKDDIDKIRGLGLGADDYMTKPFGVLELQARVRSLLRRHAPKAAPIIESQTLKIDKQTRTVMHNGQVMELTNKEYQLLLYLVENHTRVVERDEILNHIWGYDFIGESRVLDVHIRALRAKLDDDGSKYIKTIRGVGYRYVEEVK